METKYWIGLVFVVGFAIGMMACYFLLNIDNTMIIKEMQRNASLNVTRLQLHLDSCLNMLNGKVFK